MCTYRKIHYVLTMEPKEVPYDLFPVHVKHLRRNNWAQNTFKYWCAFHVRNPPLESWISAAEDIIEGLKAMGVSKAQDKICRMMKTYFALDTEVQECCSLYEVIDVLSKPLISRITWNYLETCDICFNMEFFV